MKTRRFDFVVLSCLAVLCLAGAARAQSVSTDPVGAVTIPLKGGSDTHVSLPFHRPVALEAQVLSISSGVIGLPAAVTLTASQFVYNSSTQTNTYYLQFTTGNKRGMHYTVTANSATTITLNSNNDATLNTGVQAGDTFRIIPYWTLNTLFPSGQGLYPSPTSTPVSTILLPGDNTPGINQSAAAIYFYYTGTGGPVWRKAADVVNTYPDVILPPDSYFVVRHPAATADTQLVLVGNVPMSAQAVVINNLAANTPQDNAVSLPIPATVTLGNSGLQSVLASTTTLNPKDVLFVYDPAQALQNKSATSIYFYYTGAGGPGWLKAGDVSGFHDNDTVFQPGRGFVIRRAAQSTVGSVIWTYTPAYLAN